HSNKCYSASCWRRGPKLFARISDLTPLTKKGVFMVLSRVFGQRRRVSWRRPSRPRRSWGRFSLEPCEDRTLLSLSFAPPVTRPGGLQPESVVAGAFNNDGKPDIVALNQGQVPDRTSSVSVLRGNGDGSFQPAVTTGVIAGATSLAAGDFNRDGKLDL